MKRKGTKGTISTLLAGAVASGSLVSILGYRQVDRLFGEMALVASRPIAAGEVVTAAALERARSADAEGGIEQAQFLIGKRARVAKAAGEVFRPGDLLRPARTWLADQVPEGRVLYTLTPRNSAIPYTQLRKGDRIDVLARNGRYGVRLVASDVLVMGAMRPRGSAAPTSGRGLLTALAAPVGGNQGKKQGARASLVVAIDPSAVYPLANIGDDEQVSTVLHGTLEVASGNRLTVRPEPTHRQVEVLEGLARSTVRVRH